MKTRKEFINAILELVEKIIKRRISSKEFDYLMNCELSSIEEIYASLYNEIAFGLYRYSDAEWKKLFSIYSKYSLNKFLNDLRYYYHRCENAIIEEKLHETQFLF